MAYIQLNNVSYKYPEGFLAVDKLSMGIEQGESVAIIGQNGAGKTTTVKMMNGLLKPMEGDVTIGDMNTKNFTTAQVSRKVGYVFQNPDDQIFHSSVYDEIAFGPKKMNMDPVKREKFINYSLKWTGLKEHRHENPYNLPLSIRKFITIASILAMDADVVILDEPTAGQDLLGTKILSDLLKELLRRNKTIITITHDMQFVVENFKRVIVMADKQIVRTGTPQEIFWDFESLKVAKLKQPYISSLCNELNIGDNIVNNEEAIEAICKKVLNK